MYWIIKVTKLAHSVCTALSRTTLSQLKMRMRKHFPFFFRREKTSNGFTDEITWRLNSLGTVRSLIKVCEDGNIGKGKCRHFVLRGPL